MPSRFAELRALREQGKTRASVYKSDTYEDSYEELTEEQYREQQRQRILDNDFVVDDNNGEYIDNGEDEWDNPAYSDEEVVQTSTTKKRKGKKGDKIDSGKKDGAVNVLFRKSALSAPKTTPRPAANIDTSAIDNIIGGLSSSKSSVGSAGSASSLGSIGSAGFRSSLSTPRLPRQMGRNFSPANTPTPMARHLGPRPAMPSFIVNRDPVAPATATSITDAAPSPVSEQTDGQDIRNALQPASSPPHLPDNSESEDEEADIVPLMAMMDHTPVNVRQPPPIRSPLPTSESSELDISQTLVNPSSEDTQAVSLSLDGGKIQMYWMDYTEMGNNLLLFGRDKQGRSINVRVTNMVRPIYFLPRSGATDENVSDEIADILVEHNILEIRTETVQRKFCFGTGGVPAEATYVCLYLPVSTDGRVYSSLSNGKTWSHVFGLDATKFETFVLSCNVMGPCWLDIESANAESGTTWCQLNAAVSDVSAITVASEQPEMPPVTLMSLSVRTVMNEVTSKQEIVAISGRFFKDFSIDSTKHAGELPSLLLSGVRPLEGKVFPTGFQAEVDKFHQKQNGVATIKTLKTEQALLSWFLCQVQRHDPDFVLGHHLENTHLSILVSRLRDLDVKMWSKMGRTKITSWPTKVDRSLPRIMAGRLMVDMTNDFGKSNTLGCTDWSLNEMAQLILKESRKDVAIDVSKSQWAKEGPTGLLSIVRHNDRDTQLIAALCLTTQSLPLSRQLTELAGNAWARTLAGSRVDRNNFLLLHEFTRQGYIVPPRQDHSGAKVKREKAKYTGGLVFEPERGLYRSNVLVMDFNSLYPSIIQEFNICFTTVDHRGSTSPDADLPALPDSTVNMGIFPRLIKNLVERRRGVKQLMKDPSASAEKKTQWDIRQQALKLTANSMYGCLGFEYSRFYALPLARLITEKGREILQQTRSLAEAQRLQVIYGDTDSVMINTNTTEHGDARKIGEGFKKMVNEQYKMLEIDIDNVFGAMLLNAKKKYAAVELIERAGGEIERKLSVKGLDMRRREYCQLAKDVSEYILNEILNGDDLDVALEHSHDYLRQVGSDVREGKVSIGKFIIRNQLGKNPEDYSEQQRLAHVCVGLQKIAQGDVVKAGEVISYVITERLPNETNSVSDSERARTVGDMRSQKRQIDANYYLTHQIMPVVERLLANVEGTDKILIAECLGIDTKPFRQQAQARAEQQQREYAPFESQLTDEERFKYCEALPLRCRCGHGFDFRGVADTALTATGIQCPSCQAPIRGLRLHAQLERVIRAHIERYYEGWMQCDDSACGRVTRQMGVYGYNCLGHDRSVAMRRRHMSFMYTPKQIYTQLAYFDAMFDMERAVANVTGERRLVADSNVQRFATTRSVVKKYLDNCGYRYVDMASLFSFMQPA